MKTEPGGWQEVSASPKGEKREGNPSEERS